MAQISKEKNEEPKVSVESIDSVEGNIENLEQDINKKEIEDIVEDAPEEDDEIAGVLEVPVAKVET